MQARTAVSGSTPEIQEVTAQAGVTTAPEITFWRHLNTGDDVG